MWNKWNAWHMISTQTWLFFLILTKDKMPLLPQCDFSVLFDILSWPQLILGHGMTVIKLVLFLMATWFFWMHTHTHCICIDLCVLHIHTHTDVSVFIWLFTPDLKLVVLLANNWNFVVILEWYRCDLKFRGRKSLGLKERDFLTLSPGVLWPCVLYFCPSRHSLTSECLIFLASFLPEM